MDRKKKKPMSPASLANLKPIQKGEVKNPEGGRSHDPIKSAIKRLTKAEFEDIISLALDANLEELKKIIKDPSSTALRVGVASSLIKAVGRGDFGTLTAIVERIIGSMAMKVDHTTDGKPIKQVMLYLPKNGRTKEENKE